MYVWYVILSVIAYTLNQIFKKRNTQTCCTATACLTDNVLTYDETVDAIEDTYTVNDVLADELPEIEQPALRRSARNHQPGRRVSKRGNRNIGCCIPEELHRLDYSYAFNMTVKDGIDKLGDIAVDSCQLIRDDQ